jgi:two-component system OmpR family response regulator
MSSDRVHDCRVRVLVVEDHAALAERIGEGLRDAGMAVDVVYDGAAALECTAMVDYDVVVLDRDLPRVHGDRVCRALVREGTRGRILMLTAAVDVEDRIDGLELGADDYLGKPFNPRELLARIRAILRRSESSVARADERRRRSFAGFVVDLDARSVERADGTSVPLTSAEFDLLACFVERPRRVLTRDQLLDWTRGRSADPFDRTIDVTVSRLRKKLETADPSAPPLVTTVRNGGYLFAGDVKDV